MSENVENKNNFIESFILEDLVIQSARARGEELASDEPSLGSGAFLQFLARAIQAKNIVEFGTGTGVGTLWLLGGMDSSGTLTTIDSEAEHVQLARQACDEMEIPANRVRLIHGALAEVMGKLTDGGYDMIVVREYGDSALIEELPENAYRVLRADGVLLLLHALHGGKVADLAQRDETTVARRELLRNIRGDRRRWLSSLTGLGDGLFLAVKQGADVL